MPLDHLTKVVRLFRKQWKNGNNADGVDIDMTEHTSSSVSFGQTSSTTAGVSASLPADPAHVDSVGTVSPPTEEAPLVRPKEALSHAKRGFVMAFENVSFEGRISFFRKPRLILQNVSGYLLPGTITVVMSSNTFCSRKMLEVLSGVEDKTTGSVMANGLPVVSTAFRRRVALITSIDVCTRDATVRSNLLFSVQMRVATREAERLVREVAETVQLHQLLDVKTERLSLPQLYQLAIGMELVRHPKLLALDSPTRNFSSGETHEFVSFLQQLVSRNGRLVVLSATDVTRALYEAADNFIILGPQGQLIYSGPKSYVNKFFSEHIEMYEENGDSLGEMLVMLDEKNESTRVAAAFANSTVHRRIINQVEEHRKSIASNSFEPISREASPSPNYFRKWVLLTFYICRRATIGNRNIVIAWAILLFLFFLMASLIAESGSDQNAMQNKRGVIFFLLSCSLQANIVLVDAEVREFFSGVHLRNNNYFDTTQYFTATVLRLILPRALFAFLGASCTLFILSSPFSLVLTMGLMSLAHASLTLFLVYWHPVEHDLWLVQNLYYGYCIILSGFLICLPTVPKLFSALSLLRYGYGGVVASELRHNPYSCDANASTSYCYTGDQYLEMEGFTHDSWGKSSLILFIISVILLSLVALTMKFF
ncbi:putative ABC transporter [Trypanosoma theileri]|uniref:Putative ABC transporter n=1 Tax=Trypanosoma theileri TaxID=67003 RepID=A0A1X0P4K0_9TRYP|nr:putative ABC transporter [Trypanosoma theileri]ORC91761.1 putative ABC transporter [Trypanosoma theileri]